MDSNREVPLYAQLGSILRSDIESGKYKKGRKIPTEAELSQMYGVSRITVRKALESLEKDGILIRRRGKGTFVSDSKLVRSISGISSFTQMCELAGFTPGAKVIKCVLQAAAPDDIMDMELPEKSMIMAVERIRTADKAPVSFEISHFPEEFSFLLDEDLNNCSMFEILEKKYNVYLVSTNKYLELAYATKEMAVYLNVKEYHPLILISSVSKNEEGRPIHRSHQYIVGDKIRIVI